MLFVTIRRTYQDVITKDGTGPTHPCHTEADRPWLSAPQGKYEVRIYLRLHGLAPLTKKWAENISGGTEVRSTEYGVSLSPASILR